MFTVCPVDHRYSGLSKALLIASFGVALDLGGGLVTGDGLDLRLGASSVSETGCGSLAKAMRVTVRYLAHAGHGERASLDGGCFHQAQEGTGN